MKKIYLLAWFLQLTMGLTIVSASTEEEGKRVIKLSGPHFGVEGIDSSVPFDRAYEDRLSKANSVYYHGRPYMSFDWRGTKTAFLLGAQSLIYGRDGDIIHQETVQNHVFDYCMPPVLGLRPSIEALPDWDPRTFRLEIHGRTISGGSPERLSDKDNYLAYRTLNLLEGNPEIKESTRNVVVNITSPKLPCGGRADLSERPDKFNSNCIDGQALIVAEALRQNIDMEIRHIADNAYVLDEVAAEKLRAGIKEYHPEIKSTPEEIIEYCRDYKVFRRTATFTFQYSDSSRASVRVLQEFGCGFDRAMGKLKYFVFTRKAPEVSESAKPRQKLRLSSAPYVPSQTTVKGPVSNDD